VTTVIHGRQDRQASGRDTASLFPGRGRGRRPEAPQSSSPHLSDLPSPPATWYYAKNVAALLDDDADTRLTRRNSRYAGREVLWERSRIERVRKCGRVPITEGGIPVHDNLGVSHYSGLATCGSIWAEPVCSAKIRNVRSTEISTATANWCKQGNSVFMATLTAPHDKGMRLGNLMDVIAAAFRAVIGCRAWRRLKKQHGIIGQIRSTEVTYGENGWHPHLHVLIFVEGDLGAAGLAAVTMHVQGTWSAQLVKAGYRAPSLIHGVQIVRCYSAAEAGAYIAKTQDGRSPGNELARGDLKTGRQGSRTPFQILEDFRWTGDLADLVLWHEYEKATKGKQAIAWSKGLRKLLLTEPEKTDEEVAAQEVGGEVIAVIPVPVWKKIVRIPGIPSSLLDAAEKSGIIGINALLARYKLGRAVLPSSPGEANDDEPP